MPTSFHRRGRAIRLLQGEHNVVAADAFFGDIFAIFAHCDSG